MDIFELFKQIGNIFGGRAKDYELRKHLRGHYYIAIRMSMITGHDIEKIAELKDEYYIEIHPNGETILLTIHDIRKKKTEEKVRGEVEVYKIE